MGFHQQEDSIMRPFHSASRTVAALALACLALAGCREHNEPVKPIAAVAAAGQPG